MKSIYKVLFEKIPEWRTKLGRSEVRWLL